MLHLFSNYYFLANKYDLPSKYYSFPKALYFPKNLNFSKLTGKRNTFQYESIKLLPTMFQAIILFLDFLMLTGVVQRSTQKCLLRRTYFAGRKNSAIHIVKFIGTELMRSLKH